VEFHYSVDFSSGLRAKIVAIDIFEIIGKIVAVETIAEGSGFRFGCFRAAALGQELKPCLSEMLIKG
jgi:hypothetical protein